MHLKTDISNNHHSYFYLLTATQCFSVTTKALQRPRSSVILSELTQTIRAAIRRRSASGICCATVASFIKPPATELAVQVALPKPSPWISQAHAGFSTACLLHNAWIKRYKLKKKNKQQQKSAIFMPAPTCLSFFLKGMKLHFLEMCSLSARIILFQPSINKNSTDKRGS